MQEAITAASEYMAAATAKDVAICKFVPVTTPSFGGLWEAVVKSEKHHLKYVFDEVKVVPSFGEFAMIFCQMKPYMNSRSPGPYSRIQLTLKP